MVNFEYENTLDFKVILTIISTTYTILHVLKWNALIMLMPLLHYYTIRNNINQTKRKDEERQKKE
jgi:hypothetical protein